MSARYFHGTGRRKTASARVRLYPGTGQMVVNDKPAQEFFSRGRDFDLAHQPLRLTGTEAAYNVSVKVVGGGVTGQAEAVRHGVARALVEADENLRAQLRAAGYLSRDPRAKERKKPGLVRARKAKQYTKR